MRFLMQRWAKLAAALLAICVVTPRASSASILVFSDRVSWEAAVAGPVTLVDFNTVGADYIIDPDHSGSPFDAGPFTVTETGSQPVYTIIDASPFYQDIDGTPYLLSGLQGGTDPFTRETRLTYDTPILAWATDVKARFGGEQVRYNFVGAGLVSDPVGTTSSFFGMVSTTPFTVVRMISNFASSFSFDNIASTSPIPEPTTLTLLGIGLVGLQVLRRRARPPR